MELKDIVEVEVAEPGDEMNKVNDIIICQKTWVWKIALANRFATSGNENLGHTGKDQAQLVES